LITNDQVELLSSTRFRLIGRIDNVINSGGFKLHPEQIERKLSKNLSFHFFIDSISDSLLGEKVVLVVKDDSQIEFKKLHKQIKQFTPFVTDTPLTTFNYSVTSSMAISNKERGSQRLLRHIHSLPCPFPQSVPDLQL
jgi:O-succinylbenzoic acid--CoA ligase